MKTLVIHPKDITTDFLCDIYIDKGWTVINENISNSSLKRIIKDHDRIVMLGHGSESGLFGYGKFVIEPKLVYLLREKECVAIWCNADVFFRKYELKGFYTGMIISDFDEAIMYSLHQVNYNDIDQSNKSFAKAIRESITNKNMLPYVLLKYQTILNPIILFNRQNIFATENSFFNQRL
jgi:hypothetical protein